jgi:hypothetical protein
VLSTGELLVFYEGPFDYHAAKGDMSLARIRPKLPGWSFREANAGWQGWTLSGVKESNLGGRICGFTGASGWLQSPAIWVGHASVLVRLVLWINQPARVCVAFVTDTDQVWDACGNDTGQTVGKAVRVQGVQPGSSATALEVDLRDGARGYVSDSPHRTGD